MLNFIYFLETSCRIAWSSWQSLWHHSTSWRFWCMSRFSCLLKVTFRWPIRIAEHLTCLLQWVCPWPPWERPCLSLRPMAEPEANLQERKLDLIRAFWAHLRWKPNHLGYLSATNCPVGLLWHFLQQRLHSNRAADSIEVYTDHGDWTEAGLDSSFDPLTAFFRIFLLDSAILVLLYSQSFARFDRCSACFHHTLQFVGSLCCPSALYPAHFTSSNHLGAAPRLLRQQLLRRFLHQHLHWPDVGIAASTALHWLF